MSTVVLNRVRKGFYLDSVALMRISQAVSQGEGVREAACMVGTPANRDLLGNAGLLAEEGAGAGAGDLVLAVRAASEQQARDALDAAEVLLAQPQGGGAGAEGSDWRPRSLRGALQVMPQANLALISVPGPHAAREAHRALDAGLHVMLFSDNVALEDERALKERAAEQGLLLMGPDCGTALLAGVPLAFANAVPRGGIGIVAASGTGAQEISALLARAGAGVSHIIGTGGRDLHEAIGGRTTSAALAALAADPATERIVLVSKPPAAEVAERLLAQVAACGKPVVVCFLGLPALALPPNATLAPTLAAAAEQALGRPVDAGFDVAAVAARHTPRHGHVRGLFCGGTLCAEAQLVFRDAGLPVASNVPVPGALAAAAAQGAGAAHLLLDLGADEYTQGRPHPMIAPEVRTPLIAEALAHRETAVVLLDLVLGHGSTADPAAAVVAGVARDAPLPAERPHVVASVTGTDGDPQGYAEQKAALEAAGILVAASNAQAAALAIALTGD